MSTIIKLTACGQSAPKGRNLDLHSVDETPESVLLYVSVLIKMNSPSFPRPRHIAWGLLTVLTVTLKAWSSFSCPLPKVFQKASLQFNNLAECSLTLPPGVSRGMSQTREEPSGHTLLENYYWS